MIPTSDHLHLGCGQTAADGWLNVDGSWQVALARRPTLRRLLVLTRILPRSQAEIPWNRRVIRLNLTGSLPFPDDSFQAVYSSHTLEHLYRTEARVILEECRRVLKPGGVCRIVVPDLESIVRRYICARDSGQVEAATQLMEELRVHDEARQTGLIGLYYRLTAFHQHKWMYDAASLSRMFVDAGFRDVHQAEYLKSGIRRIAEVEHPGRILDGQGVAIEGRKG
jgi:predicted SAM-dependent methyltransferase